MEQFWQHHKTLLASDFAGCQGALNAFTYTFGEGLPLFYALLPGNRVCLLPSRLDFHIASTGQPH